MKFNFCIKAIIIIVLISSLEMTELRERLSTRSLLRNKAQNRIRSGNKSRMRDSQEEVNFLANSSNFRFIDYEKMNNIKEKNLLMLNSEVLNAKPPADREEEETEVTPQRANAGSEFIWKFLWWTIMYFPAKHALKSDSSYWLSRRGVVHDHWEAEFDTPQKIDLIEISWRLPPKRFRVFIKLDEQSEYLPVTEIFEKTQHITKEGKVASKDAISMSNAIAFHKPVFAKRVRINLNEPVKKSSFSITFVKFFQKKTTMLIKNELFDDTQHYCLYVNTNRPRNGSRIEAYPCLKSLTLANNNELWIYNNDSSIRHHNSKMCIGFDAENNLVLRQCGDYNPAYVIRLRNDNTLYFNGYSDKCIVLDETKKISESFVNEKTELFVSSEADRQTFKKENMKFTGENYWHSTPGIQKVTLQILFGKIINGPNRGKFENKKIDLIKIDWIKQPKKFMIYTWKPGFSWNLRYVFDNYKSKTSEISIIGEDAAAVMLVLEEAEIYQELGNLPAYAIREISITYDSIAVKNANCADYNKKLKIFDFDTQYFRKLENVKDYNEVRKKLSVTFEKMIAGYTNIKKTMKYIQKAKIKAMDLIAKLITLKRALSDETIKKLREFKSETLSIIKNSVFQAFIMSKKVKNFLGQVTHQKSSTPRIGTKENPAIDCLSVKKLQKNSLSGFYYISSECMPKPLRVYCDFTIFGDAVDIFVFNDDSKEPNPDLSYLMIKDFNSVRYQCAKQGLYPLEINNADTVKRIYQVLISMGYDLSKPITVPLGYDYSCGRGRCTGMINSLNDKQTPVMTSFFYQSGKRSKGLTVKPGPFAGLGYSTSYSMLKFDASVITISALVCSTNHFRTDVSDTQVKTISCDLSPANNGNIFTEGGNILVECPISCHDSPTPVYGTNIYHFKSSVCKAAIHAGVLTTKGGKVNVRVRKGIPKYSGSILNGITSEDLDKSDGMNSFALIKYVSKCPISQFKQLAAEEVKVQMEESNGEESGDNNDDNNGSQPSSFIQTSAKVAMSQFRDQFEKELNSNELEGVELDDIRNAGLNTNHPDFDLYKQDNDFEDYQYNNPNSGGEAIHNNAATGLSGDNYNNNFSSSDELASMSGYNKNNYDSIYAGNYGNNYKFNQLESENQAKSMIQSELESLNEFGTSGRSELDLQAETYMYTRNLDPSQGQKRDRLESEDPNKSTKDVANKMLDDINKATNDVLNDNSKNNPLNNLNSNNNPNNNNNSPKEGDKPRPREDSLPKAPRKGQTQPDLQDDEPQTGNKKIEPTTDEGNNIIRKIRQVVDYDYLKMLKTKVERIKELIGSYKKGFAWSKEGSRLSMSFIKRSLQMLEKYKLKVLYIMKKLSDESQARVMMTKKVKHDWWDELNQLESKDIFKLNYAIPAEILLRKVMLTLDTKSKLKSNWDVYKEKIKGRAQAVGITSNIYSKNQVWGSLLKINGREYNDFNLNIDILLKSKGVVGVAFRMRDEYNYYAFIIDKTKGVKTLSLVKNGKARILHQIKDGGILLDNWHRINVQTSAGKLKVHIYDMEQSKKSVSEKVIEMVDGTYSSGGIGVFVNNIQGFYFDNLIVAPMKCWTPWQPMKDLHIVTPMSSVYYEDFSGSLTEKFERNDPEDVVDGPSEWKFNPVHTSSNPAGLSQTSLAYDKSSSRRPSMIIKKKKMITNGVINISFIPFSEEGAVSIIFKYFKSTDTNGQTNENFYIFDMVANQTSPQFELRRFVNGVLTVMKTVNTPVKDLHVLGYKASILNRVEISLIRDKIVIKVSIEGSDLQEVINVEDNSIPHGFIGVGTFKTKAVFTSFEMFPPILHMTETEKNKVLTAESNSLFFPVLPGEKVDKRKGRPKGENVKGAVNESEGQDVEGLRRGGKKESGASVGWKTCLTTSTKKDREVYCAREFPIPQTRNKCVNNFCDRCCEGNVEKTHKNAMYMCKKACSRSTVAESGHDDYKNVCISSENFAYSVYEYCELKLKNDIEQKKTCKIDMCNLCCTTMDMMKSKNYSIDSMKKCFQDCSKEFNK